MIFDTKIYKLFCLVLIAGLVVANVPPVFAQTSSDTRTIIFPVIGRVTYWDDFGAARDGGARQHEGNDLMGAKMMPLVAAVDGRVRVSYPQESWGYSVTITDKDGYTYHYLHMNNDTPGTDDGLGGGQYAYAVDVDDGAQVVAGQLIGWMGDSGNAETTQAHLHFEIRRPDRTPVSPYASLQSARKITAPVQRPQQPGEFLPFDQFEGGSFIAAGNLDRDSEVELVVGAGPGGGPHVKVLDDDGDEIVGFFPYDLRFGGGVDVAVGDVNDDGKMEVVTAPAGRGGPNVKVYDLAGRELSSFMAYDPAFMGGVNVTVADIDDDGEAEIITAPGKGGGPHVRAFSMDGQEKLSFFAYDATFNGGVDVAAFAQDDDVYIATAPSTGGGPHIKVFNEDGGLVSEFNAYDPAHRGGVRISLADVTGRGNIPEIITAPLLGGSQIKMFALNGDQLGTDWGFEEWWSGSWDVAGYGTSVYTAVGPNSKRRASVREVELERSSSRNQFNRNRN